MTCDDGVGRFRSHRIFEEEKVAGSWDRNQEEQDYGDRHRMVRLVGCDTRWNTRVRQEGTKSLASNAEKRKSRWGVAEDKRPARDSRRKRFNSAFCLRNSRSRLALIASNELFDISRSSTLRSRRASAASWVMVLVGLSVPSVGEPNVVGEATEGSFVGMLGGGLVI